MSFSEQPGVTVDLDKIKTPREIAQMAIRYFSIMVKPKKETSGTLNDKLEKLIVDVIEFDRAQRHAESFPPAPDTLDAKEGDS